MQPLAAAIIARGDRVLMTRRRFREGSLVWGFPTGECEPGETPEQAATREVEEEVGLTVAVERRLGERIHPVTRRHMVYLACTVLAGEARLIDHEELAELAWCTLAEVIERAAPAGGLYPPVQEYLERALTRAQP
ncbi:MAG TPA: NUDIX domain-containing protein [Candidatus Dormibacteraeota bacterium]|nr:NUDIX domain-containing protein [Candidatus Dormibacteraeota bacterium]